MYEEPFFDKLFQVLEHGDGHLKGATESLLRSDLQCLYRVMLQSSCSGLQSRYEERLEAWQKTCLDPSKDTNEVLALMSPEEQADAHKIQVEVANSSVAQVWSKRQDLKAFLCLQMKVVDDGCLNFAAPRLADKDQKQNAVAADHSQVPTSRPGLTVAATTDDVNSLISSELDAVRHLREHE